MNPDADHQFGVPPALEDEIGTELKFTQRGERPSSFEMSSEPADKMTPAAPVAPFPTVPNSVPALVPAVSGARDAFSESAVMIPAAHTGVDRPSLQTPMQSDQVDHLDLSGHWSRNMAKFKEECNLLRSSKVNQREAVPNKFGVPSKAEALRQEKAARLSLKANQAARLLLSAVPTKDNPHLAPSPLSEPTCSNITTGGDGGGSRDLCGLVKQRGTYHQEWEDGAGDHHPKGANYSLNPRGVIGKGKSTSQGEAPARKSYQWTTNSEIILIQSIKDKSFSRFGEWTLNPEGCPLMPSTYLHRLRIGMKEMGKEMGLEEIPTDAEICIKLHTFQRTYGSDSQAFCKCERDIQQALEKETESSSGPHFCHVFIVC
jgi:hypothetical protein